MCKVSRRSEDHLVQGLADFGSFSQKMPLNSHLSHNQLKIDVGTSNYLESLI